MNGVNSRPTMPVPAEPAVDGEPPQSRANDWDSLVAVSRTWDYLSVALHCLHMFYNSLNVVHTSHAEKPCTCSLLIPLASVILPEMSLKTNA